VRVAWVSLALKNSESRKTTTPQSALGELLVTIKLSAWHPPLQGRFLFGRLGNTVNIRSWQSTEQVADCSASKAAAYVQFKADGGAKKRGETLATELGRELQGFSEPDQFGVTVEAM
jgi:hypothetical protein